MFQPFFAAEERKTFLGRKRFIRLIPIVSGQEHLARMPGIGLQRDDAGRDRHDHNIRSLQIKIRFGQSARAATEMDCRLRGFFYVSVEKGDLPALF